MKHEANPNVLEISGIDFSSLDDSAACDAASPKLLQTLELAMTNSAFGYEYARKALDEEGDFGVKAEMIRSEMESFKDTYFEARVKMRKLDPHRLESFETALKFEKAIVFAKNEYLH